MASFMVKIVKQFGGEEWEQDYCVLTDADPDPDFEEADWTNATGSTPNFTDNNTNPDDGAYVGGASLIHALIGFERLLHYSNVQFVRLFAWDGVKNPSDSSTFITVPLGFNGLKPLPSGDANKIAPGNITWMLGKQPLGFGRRAGRAYYRMALADEDVRAGGKRLLDWSDATIAANHNTFVADYLSSSLLDSHFGAGVGLDDAVLSIPRFSPGPVFKGNLLSSTPISAMVSKYPDARQVQKGRKRKVTTVVEP